LDLVRVWFGEERRLVAPIRLFVVVVAATLAVGCQSLCTKSTEVSEAGAEQPSIACANESVDRNGDGVVDQRDCLRLPHTQTATYVGWQECESCHRSRDASAQRGGHPVALPQ